MRIYVDANYADSDFKCYTSNPDGLYLEVEHPFFDGKCKEFIEGYRFVPDGQIFKRSDGQKFVGEMIAPWKPYDELASAQAQYELDMAEAAAAYQEGVDSAYDQ